MKPDRHQGLTDAFSHLAAAATGVIATLVFLILPIMVSSIAGQFGWNEQQIGWLAAADMGGSALASLLLAAVISRIDWKKSIRIAIGFVVAGNLASIFADSLGALLFARVLTGFSNGVIMSIVFAQLCRSDNPDRYFGSYVFLQLSLQAVLLPLLPKLIAHWGMDFVYVFLALASFASMALLRHFPPQPTVAPLGQRAVLSQGDRMQSRGPGRWGLLALFAQAVYFLAPAAVWAYFGVIGGGFGLELDAVGKALGLATFAGMAGALVVVILANRFSRNSSMAVGTLVSLIAVWLLLQGSGYYEFLLAAALINFSWNYAFPYQMGTLAMFDNNGSLAVLGLVVQTFGLSFGPLMASMLLAGNDFSSMLWVCGACYGLSLLLFLFSSRGAPKSPARPDPVPA